MPDDERTTRSKSNVDMGTIRQQSILALVEQGNVVAVGEIAERFGVHTETIRRDIRTLEREGLLRRVHGGAIATRPAGVNARLRIVERVNVDREAKILAAQAALPLFEDSMNVFIGASSTMVFLAQELAHSGKSLQVTTNMIDVAMALTASPRCAVTLLGGVVNGQNHATGGFEMFRAMTERLFDLSIVGSSALSFELGLLGPTRHHVDMNSILRDRSGTMAVAMHRAKFDRTDAHISLPLGRLDVIATDGEPSADQRKAFTAAAVRILTPRQ